MKHKVIYLFSILLLLLVYQSCEKAGDTIFGKWKLNLKESTDLVTWRYRQLEMTIRENGDRIEIINRWKSRRAGEWVDSIAFVPGGNTVRIPIKTAHWQENWYMNVLSIPGTVKKVSAYWDKPKKALTVYSGQLVQTSQGRTVIRTERNFSLNRKGDKLTVIEKRSSRPTRILLSFDRIQN